MSRGFCIYSRKSKLSIKGESIENQIELCRRYILLHHGEEAVAGVHIYEDEGFSGGTLERPQFKEMMAAAKSGQFHTIVVYRLDRISRNIGDFAKLIEELGELAIAFVSIKEQFDTASPLGRAMMYIAGVFSQLERETIAERIRDNMHELAKTGRWLGGVTPTGYTSEAVTRLSVEGKYKRACHLKLIPEEGLLVQRIFRHFLTHGSLTKTDAFLLQYGYRSKNNRPFSRFAIKNILSNPVYMIADDEAYQYWEREGADLFSSKADFDGQHGLLCYNRTLQKTGKAHQLRPVQDWIVCVGQHPGLISGADWIRVQTILTQNRSKGYRKTRSSVALLSGLLFCAHCGDYMRPKMSARHNAQGDPIYYYLCTTKERSQGICCSMANVDGNTLDAAVTEALCQLPLDRTAFLHALERGTQKLSEQADAQTDALTQLQRLLSDEEMELQGLLSVLGKVAGTGAEGPILAHIERLQHSHTERQHQLQALQRADTSPEVDSVHVDLSLASLQQNLHAMPIEQQRAALRRILQKAIWDGQTVRLEVYGTTAEATPLRENSK